MCWRLWFILPFREFLGSSWIFVSQTNVFVSRKRQFYSCTASLWEIAILNYAIWSAKLEMNNGSKSCEHTYLTFDGLVQDCSNSIANALELLQSCAKPLLCCKFCGHRYPNTVRYFDIFWCSADQVWGLHTRASNNYMVNTLKLRQSCHLFPDNILKWIFFNANVWILIRISLNFVQREPITNIPALIKIMAWRSNKPLSEPMMFSLPRHTCVTQLQWVERLSPQIEMFEFWFIFCIRWFHSIQLTQHCLSSQPTSHYCSQLAKHQLILYFVTQFGSVLAF